MKASTIGFVVSLIAGAAIGLYSTLFYAAPPPVTASTSDVGHLLAMLRPFSDASNGFIGNSSESVEFFADGSVYITVKDNNGNESDGRGSTFSKAVGNLKSRSASIAQALK